jgi:hypothetical protein
MTAPDLHRDCNCEFSDAYRCAKSRGSPHPACSCRCHRYLDRDIDADDLSVEQWAREIADE